MNAHITLQRAGLFLGLLILVGDCLTPVFFPAVSATLSPVSAPWSPRTPAPRAGPSPLRPTQCRDHASIIVPAHFPRLIGSRVANYSTSEGKRKKEEL